jgi:hypothetical protein
MSDVFMDTVGTIAVWNSSDPWHQTARGDPADLRVRETLDDGEERRLGQRREHADIGS